MEAQSVADILKDAKEKRHSFTQAAFSAARVCNAPTRLFVGDANSKSLFDLASLSKTIYSFALLIAMSENKLSFDRKISEFLPEFPNKDLNLDDLLSYKIYAQDPHAFKVFNSLLFHLHPHAAASSDYIKKLIERMQAVKIEGKYSKYSNYPSWIMRLILEKLASASPEAYIIDRIFMPAKMYQARFAPCARLADRLVKSEKCSKDIYIDKLKIKFRFKKSYPADEVAHQSLVRFNLHLGHSGVFASLPDIENYMNFLFRAINGELDFLSSNIQRSILNFVNNAESDSLNRDRFFAGFRIKGRKDRMLSDNFSMNSILHSGFTGTFFALDLLHGKYMILLSNRTYPNRSLHKHALAGRNSSEDLNKLRKELSQFVI